MNKYRVIAIVICLIILIFLVVVGICIFNLFTVKPVPDFEPIGIV